ncbi:processed acidic surface protein [Bacillus firmus]|uniref:processed acidic surface protein n=1 Tax=Cytobacillus firmus TaxID=1399 RepID=UPI00157FC698|nr:processed acidic surface protein [Cytobacillus firmus]MBG9550463.1 peptidase [Cytobacillus firmus]MBG9602474.1 peptidase [Cytobacillus firmus]MBG9657427.1 peptidase [Cytobacillus firmus]MDD9312394.1 processed acidic surface protein [Cytobacillus firmus]MED1905247.1 processed acidic surface protein [Cytobacillus firmus]
MKRLSIVIASILLLSLFPAVSLAAPNDEEVAKFLKETNWAEEGLNDHLEYFWDMSIEDFETIEEMIEYLGEPITEENLQQLLADYGFENEEELTALLVENGEMEPTDDVRDVFRYFDALDSTVSFLTYTGTEINDETLQQLLNDYGLTKEELLSLLEENDDSLENYEYIEDLDIMVSIYMGGDEMPGDDEMTQILGDIDLTDEELEALFAHFMTLDFEDPELLDKMMDLESRLMAFGEFDSADDLTEAEIAELISIMQEMMNLFQLDAEFYLFKDGEKIHLTTAEMIALEDTNGYDMLIELYNTQGQFLADMIITADMFSSELIEDTVTDLDQAETVIKKQDPGKVKQASKPVKTVKGGKLPNTAGNYIEGVIAGIGLLLIGIAILLRRKVKEA